MSEIKDDDKPELLSSEQVFRGRLLDVTVDTLREHGKTFVREVVKHPGSGCIVALDADETVALVRQYRHAAGKYLLEIPAGTRDGDESPEHCARRELEEELGVVAERLELLAEFFVSPGLLAEKMWVYLATGLTETSQRLDEDEHLEIERVTLDDALEMIRRGEIEDAKTIIGITQAAARVREKRIDNGDASKS